MEENNEWRDSDSQGNFEITTTAITPELEKESRVTIGKDVQGKKIPVAMSTDLNLGMKIPAEDTPVNETDNSRV